MDNHNIQPRKTNSKNKNTNSLAIQQAHLGHTRIIVVSLLCWWFFGYYHFAVTYFRKVFK